MELSWLIKSHENSIKVPFSLGLATLVDLFAFSLVDSDIIRIFATE
jgi:hypothetical protein